MADKRLDILINIIKKIAGLTDTKNEVDHLGTATEKTAKKGKKSFKALQKQVAKLNKSFTTSIKTVTSWGKKLTAVTAGAVTGLGALAVNAANFNKEIARASTMTDKLGFKEMRQQALEMSQEIGVAKSEIADGFYQALSASVPSDNLFSFVSTAAKVAVADGSAVATVVDGLTTVLNAFKIDTADTDKVADTMFKTVANGKTTFAELARSMAAAAPTASGLGVSYQELLAAIATMTKGGEASSTAFTKMNGIMLGLNTALGDGWSKTRTFQEAIEDLAKKSGYSASKLEKIFGRENIAGVFALVGRNAKGAAEDLDEYKDVVGTVDEAHAKLDEFKFWDKAWLSVGAVVQQIGNALNGAIKNDVIEITTKIGEWTKNTEFWDNLTTKFKAIRDEIVGLVEAVKGGGGREVFDTLGDLLELHFKKGAAKAINLLATGVLEVGKMLGKAALDCIKNNIAEVVMWGPMLPAKKGFDFVKNQISGRDGAKEETKVLNLIDTKSIDDEIVNVQAALDKLAGVEGQLAQKISEEGCKVYDASGEVAAAYDSAGNQLDTAGDEFIAAVYDAEGNVESLYESADDFVRATEKMNEGATIIGDASTAIEEKTTELQEKAKTGIAAFKAVSDESTGKMTTAISDMGGSVKDMANTTKTGLNQINRELSSTYSTLNSTLASIMSQLEAINRTAANAEYQANINQSQIRNIRS